jgi:hypothetical protein
VTPLWSRITDLLSRRSGRDSEAAVALDPWSAVPADVPREATPISALLAEIEAGALATYAAHGLPDQKGHYARSAKSPQWRFVSETLTAEERWALVTAQKPGSTWRFGALEDLGDQADSPPDLQRAGRILRACRQLRTRLAEGGLGLGEDLEAALRLGVEWQALQAEPPPESRPESRPEPQLQQPPALPAAADLFDGFMIPSSDEALASPKPGAAKPRARKPRRPRSKAKGADTAAASKPKPRAKRGPKPSA